MSRQSARKPGRPRDALGRPLPWDAPNELKLEDFDSLSTWRNHALAVAHFNAGRYFPAHEAWETCWKQMRGTDEEEFFKGLAQLGAGYVHLLRGNTHGTLTLLARAEARLSRYPSGRRGIDTEAVVARAAADRAAVEAGVLVPGPGALEGSPPRL